MAAEGHLRARVLVDQDGDGVLVVEFDLLPAVPRPPAVDRIGREFADAHEIGPQEIGGLLDVPCHPRGVIRHGGDLGGHRAVHELSQIETHPDQRVGEGLFLDEPEILLFEAGPEIPSPGPHETALPLIHPLHLLVQDQGGGPVHPLQGVDRIGVGMAEFSPIASVRDHRFSSLNLAAVHISASKKSMSLLLGGIRQVPATSSRSYHHLYFSSALPYPMRSSPQMAKRRTGGMFLIVHMTKR